LFLLPTSPPEAAKWGGGTYFVGVAVLANKLIHLPDKPAGVAQIGIQTIEVVTGF
jgi:hypothetical protein